MNARLALIITVTMLATAVVAPSALAGTSTPPVELAPGEEVVSYTTKSAKGSQYIVELLSSIKGVKIGTDKTTVLVNNGGKTHPIEIDYGNVLSGSKGGVVGKLGTNEAFAAGSADGTGDTGKGGGDTGGGIGFGHVAGLLLGLTVFSRVIGIFRQLGAGNR